MKTEREDLDEILAKADHFTVLAFRGRGMFDRATCKTLDEARRRAAEFYRDRPIGIYVVAYDHDGTTERSRHVENWEPKRKA